jgi:probable addiction module antidote protein
LEKLQGGNIMATADYKDGLSNRLQDPEYASEYLNEALKEDSQELFMLALRDVATAVGFANAARESKLNRETMYRMLSEKGNPNLSSLNKLLDTFGLSLTVVKKETVG